ncbi:MAG: 3'-5' exoribonuclease YhaM family protein [Planctomycetota bacterium]
MQEHLLKNLERGARIEGVFLVETANFKQTRNGKHFLQLVLRDHSASVKAVRWDSNRDEFRGVERCPFLRVSGRVEEYQGNTQIIVDQLEPVGAEDARVDPAEFLPRSRFDLDAMQKELEEIIASISDDGVRRIVLAVLDRPGLRRSFRNAPAGKTMHHAYVGGLLEHVLSLAQVAERICDHYRWLDRSMLIAGVVLHDIAKTAELSFDTGFGYTDEGQLIGHIVLVSRWIREAAETLGDVDPETVLQLEHLVLAHHGKLEFGSPKKPMTAEALAMHFIDNLDAKLAGYWQAFRQANPGPQDSRFGDQNFMLEVRPYFPRRLDGLSDDLLPPRLDDGEPARRGAPVRATRAPEEARAEDPPDSGSLPF